jgi:hypothetical protein
VGGESAASRFVSPLGSNDTARRFAACVRHARQRHPAGFFGANIKKRAFPVIKKISLFEPFLKAAKGP